MKKKICFISVMELIFLIYLFHYSFAQNNNIMDYSCAMNNIISGELHFPAKQTLTGENYMRILIVYVMFDNEDFDPYNSNWTATTTTGPIYKGTMIAETKNSISDWWNSYNPGTQSISSWFCENSRGQTHVIGKEYFVKLQHTVNYYIANFSTAMAREDAINKEIYDSLTSQNII